MEILVELITFIFLAIIVLIIFCFICVVIRKSSGEQNSVHPDEIELRPLEQAAPENGAQPPNPLMNGIMLVNEVISRRVEMIVRLDVGNEELEFGEAVAV